MKWKNGILHDYTNKNTIFFLVTLKMCFITVRRVLLISKEAGLQKRRYVSFCGNNQY
mgnify:CR=1 FL=1